MHDNFSFVQPQAFPTNDVSISDEPKELLFDKHVEYIANHGNDKNDYVKQRESIISFVQGRLNILSF